MARRATRADTVRDRAARRLRIAPLDILHERHESARAMKRATYGTADRPITLLSDSDEAELQEPPSKQARRSGAAEGKAREQQDARAAAAAMATRQAAATAQQKAQEASLAAEDAKK